MHGVNKMEDMEIIKQLRHGNHLEPKELTRAGEIINLLAIELDLRLRFFK